VFFLKHIFHGYSLSHSWRVQSHLTKAKRIAQKASISYLFNPHLSHTLSLSWKTHTLTSKYTTAFKVFEIVSDRRQSHARHSPLSSPFRKKSANSPYRLLTSLSHTNKSAHRPCDRPLTPEICDLHLTLRPVTRTPSIGKTVITHTHSHSLSHTHPLSPRRRRTHSHSQHSLYSTSSKPVKKI